MATIMQICQICGNRLQPQRARIKNGTRRVSSLLGICDIGRCTARVYDPDRFGLATLDISPTVVCGQQGRSVCLIPILILDFDGKSFANFNPRFDVARFQTLETGFTYRVKNGDGFVVHQFEDYYLGPERPGIGGESNVNDVESKLAAYCGWLFSFHGSKFGSAAANHETEDRIPTPENRSGLIDRR